MSTTTFPNAFYSGQQAQAIDRYAIEQAGIPGILLMKRAAMAALQHIQQHFPDARQLHIVCGIGNNGGDGYMLGQLATMAGFEVSLYQVGPTHKIKGDALTALHELVDCGLNPYPLTTKALQKADLIIDALFGIGLDRPVSADFAQTIDYINQHPAPKLALDTPSGIHATTGAKLGSAVQATHTLSFIVPKLGLYQADGKTYAGNVFVHDLYLPKEILGTQIPKVQSLIPLKDKLITSWQNRPANSHKGTFGTTLLIGGDDHMMGAIQLAAHASLVSGSGLTKVITQSNHQTPLTQAHPEIMAYTEQALPSLLEQASAIGIGCGLGQSSWGKSLFLSCLSPFWQAQPSIRNKHDFFKNMPESPVLPPQTLKKLTHCPIVWDADALNLLAKLQRSASEEKTLTHPLFAAHHIFTPHPGEAARLLNTTSDAIQQDRLHTVQQLQQQYGGIWVLKGAGTLIADGEQVWLNPYGNAGMATGGMGDVLTGLIAGLLAQGFAPLKATQLGVLLHSLAADDYSQNHTMVTLIPSRLIESLETFSYFRD